MRRAFAPLFAAPLGAITALGQQPYSMWWCTLLGLSAIFALHNLAQTRWAAARLLWLFGAGYFALALRWILEPFQVEADVFGWMAPFALAGMAAGLALFWGLAGYVAKSLESKAISGAGALVITLSALELARAYILTGFPWAGLAQIWVDTKAALLLATLGPHGLALLTLIVAASPWLKHRALFLGVAALALALGFYTSTGQAPLENTSTPIIRLVQPNAPQHEKWDRTKAPLFFQRQIAATQAKGGPDLIVWPETAIPRLLNYAQPELEAVARAAGQAPVIVGIQREESGNYFNSLIFLENGAITQVYDKHHLVPFGEYMPFPEFFKSLGIRALAQRAEGGYTPGSGAKPIELPIGKALPLICYEAVFPRHSSSAEGRARLIVQVTNDAWFGTYAGPQQHLAQAQMRAIEQGLPLIRSANTGISAIINAQGQITAQLPLGVHGHIDAPLPPALPPTIYARLGDIPAVLTILGALAFLSIRRIFND
jgi:apolipoprotein N-acyltransferase